MRNALRILALIAVVGCVLLLILLLVARWLVSTDRLEAWVFAPIEAKTGVAVHAEGFGVGVGGLRLQELTVRGPMADRGQSEATSAPEHPPLLRVGTVTVRPQWAPLLRGEIVIGDVVLDDVHLLLHRDASGTWNVDRLVTALTAAGEEAPPANAAPEAYAPAMDVHRIEVRDATLDLVDELDRPAEPLRLSVRVDDLTLGDLADTGPASFRVEASTELARDSRTTFGGSGTFTTSPVAVVLHASVGELDVDALVSRLAHPGGGRGPEPGPLELEGWKVEARLEADRIRYGGLLFTDTHLTAALGGPKLEVHVLRADLGGGHARADARIDFGLRGFVYEGTASLERVDLPRAAGWLADVDWGAHRSPILSARAKAKAQGTTFERLRDTVSLDANIEIDALDLGALSRAAGNGDDTVASPAGGELGPYDTGRGRLEVSFSIDHAEIGALSLAPVRGSAALADGRLRLASLETSVAGGTFALTADVDLTRPGLAYSASATLADARIEELTRTLPQASWGTRTGLVGGNLHVQGAGSSKETALQHLEADGEVTWTDGRVADSLYLREISDVTGIPGFRNLRVMNSGGKFRVRDRSVSSDRLRLWGPDAGIQAAGRVGFDGSVDADVALAIGPTSNRDLFSTGIALPYVYGKDGWRFVPLRVTGNLRDPKMSVPPKGVLRSALTTVPGVGTGMVSGGLNATGSLVRDSADAIAEGTQAVLPGVAGAAVGGVARGGGKIVERSGQAVGSLVEGVGGLFLGSTGGEIGNEKPPDGEKETDETSDQ